MIEATPHFVEAYLRKFPESRIWEYGAERGKSALFTIYEGKLARLPVDYYYHGDGTWHFKEPVFVEGEDVLAVVETPFLKLAIDAYFNHDKTIVF
jgi:hypothetical protein